MSTTTTHNLVKPQTGDRGSVFWPALEAAIQRLNDHVHNGSDSEALNPRYFSKTTNTLALASWSAVAGQAGTYRQLETCPTGYTVDGSNPKFMIGSGSDAGAIIYPSTVKVSATTYYVYINDNTIDVKVVYV
jgi:hypothetical protein